MTENWQFFPCSMGDDQAFIYLNLGAKDSISDVPSNLAKFRLRYKEPRENGLPTDKEFEPVKAIEDRIESYSEKIDSVYVGRVTVGGYRLFYVYTNQDEKEWLDFLGQLGNETGYEIKLSYREDPEHSGYFNDLYPTVDDWQVIKDLQVIETLEKNGDDGSEKRKIDHWIYFPSEEPSIDFIDWASSDRFTYEPEHSHPTDDGKYCVRLSHLGTVKLNDITSHSIALRRKAAEFGGEYDGWETPIIKDGENQAVDTTPISAPR